MEIASSAPSASRETGTPPPEFWKEQLGYVSGTILAWGTLLVQFWPVLARLQTGAHVHALGRDEGVQVTAMTYYMLALLVAVGLGMLIFGSAHIVARGFWFARFWIDSQLRTTGQVSDRVARTTYVVIHLFWATSLFLLLLVSLSAVSALLTTLFTTRWRWPSGLSRLIASIVAFAPLYVAGIVFYRRRRSEGPARMIGFARRIGYRNIAIAYLSLLFFWLIAIEFSYVADVSVQRHVFSRTTDPNIVITVELGGAVSHPSPARLMLIGNAKDAPLPITRVASGLYVSVLPTKSLPAASYQVSLTYPHGAISPTFPFVRSRITRSVGFVLLE